jgi:peroxiredoxin
MRILSLRAFAHYYKDVRSILLFAVILALPLALTPGCDRGAHPAQTGKAAPDFTVSDGVTTVHLARYRGQIVLLNFWATWCAPCVQEMPALIELHHERPDLAIVAVSVDEDPQAYSRFLARYHVDLITVRDPEQKAATLYHSEGWPETYIIDRSGVIRRKIVGDPDWTNPEIRAYLKSL